MSCDNPKYHPSYVFGSSIITLVIAMVSFLSALSLNSAIQKAIEYYEPKWEQVETKFSISFLIIALSILLIFFSVYFIDGERF